METFPHLLSLVLQGADLLVASVWQGVLLIAAAALGLRLARKLTPSDRSRMLAVVLLIAVGLAAWPLLLRGESSTPSGAVHLRAGWALAAMAAWLLAALYRGGRLCRDAVSVRRLVRGATPVPLGATHAELLGGARGAILCSSDQVDRPCVAGILHPRILVPADLFATLSAPEMAQVLLHEREHLRRGDDVWNLVQQVCLVFLPLHPALLWLDRQLSRERELACDDEVLRSTQERQAYASCLVKIAEESMLRRGLDLALSLLGSRSRSSELVSRVQRILGSTQRIEVSRRTHKFALTSVTVAILLGTAFAARSPRFVSFDGGTSVAAATPLLAQTGPVTRFARNVRTEDLVPRQAASEGRPVLTNAVFVAGPRAKAVQPERLKSARIRRLAARSRTPATEPSTLSTQPQIQHAGAQVVLTRIQVLQPVYAAVPLQDGWLIVQL